MTHVVCGYGSNMAQGGIPGTGSSKDRPGWKTYALSIAGVLLAILVLQNLQEVEFKFLFINATIPLIFALLIVGALGALIGWATPRVKRGGYSDSKRDQD